MYQQTLGQSFSIVGRGLHLGKRSTITLHPSDPDTGIIFKRIDRPDSEGHILASWENIHDLPLCTCLSNGRYQIRTVEHLLAGLVGCGVDNALVEVKGEEIPLTDGSAAEFVRKILIAGILPQSELRRFIRIKKQVEYHEGSKRVMIEPSDEFEVDVTISLRKIGRLNWTGAISPQRLQEEILFARTFGRIFPAVFGIFLAYFSKTKICLGASPKNSIYIWGGKGITKGGLRAPDEYVRHRVLDLVGDMALAGHPIRGKVTTSSTSHRLNHCLMEKLFTDKEAWVLE